MTLLAALFMSLAIGRGIMYLTDSAKVEWDAIQIIGLASWVIGFILAADVLGWIPNITYK